MASATKTAGLTKVTRAADKAASAFRARDDAIREASSAGASLAQIGKAAGLSRARVHQIVHASDRTKV